jgi:C1A family cysteine protease
MPGVRRTRSLNWLRVLAAVAVLILFSAIDGRAQPAGESQVASGMERAMSAEAAARLSNVQEEMASGDHSFSVGYNPAMEYPLDQLTGLKEPDGWRDTAPFVHLEAPVATLPASYDWRPGGVTSIKNQRDCGSCWAFGTVGPLESQIKLKCGIDEDVAEQYLVSCNLSGWDCNGGWWAHNYHKANGSYDHASESEPGAVKESGSPYSASDLPCQGPYEHPYKLSSWGYVGGQSSVPSVQAIKQAIHTYGPVGVAICAGNSFQAYRTGIFNKDETQAACGGGINHAVVLVGWNDDLGPDNGYWILRNSWGAGWGESGYMRIRYGVSRVGYSANFVVLDSADCPAASLLACAQASELSNGVPYSGSTISGPSKVAQYGPNGSIASGQTGPEAIHRLVTSTVGDLTASLSSPSPDLRFFILNACDPFKTLVGGSTSHNIASLAPGTYYFVVDGANGASGAYTLTVSKSCSGLPSAPDGLSYPTKDGDGKFTVSWNLVSEATGYTLQHASDPAFADAATVYEGGARLYSAKVGVGMHYFRVLAANECGASGWTTRGVLTVPPPSIRLRYPNGDRTFAAGSTRIISWAYTGNPGPWVKIQLLKGNKAVRTIARQISIGADGKGSFVWTILPRQASGNNYRIKINSRSNTSIVDTSDGYFTIHK